VGRVRLGVVALSDGKMPVGKIPIGKMLLGKIPVGKILLGKRPVGNIPVGKREPRSPPGLVGTVDDCVGSGSEDGIPLVEPGMMKGPRIVVGEAELGSCEMGDALGGTTVPGMPPVEAAAED
jgi:hypothetical protein